MGLRGYVFIRARMKIMCILGNASCSCVYRFALQDTELLLFYNVNNKKKFYAGLPIFLSKPYVLSTLHRMSCNSYRTARTRLTRLDLTGLVKQAESNQLVKLNESSIDSIKV